MALALTLALATGGWWAWDAHRKTLNKQLSAALLAGDLERSKSLIRQGAEVDACREGSYTALTMAAGEGDVAWVRELLQRGAKVNATGGMPLATPLYLAAGASNRTLIWRIPSNASGLAQQAWKGQASSQEYREIVQLLLRHGADVKGPEPSERTPLYWALQCHETGIAEDLLRAGADPHLVAPNEPPLRLAATYRGGEPVVHLLLEQGADPNVTDTDFGGTALMDSVLMQRNLKTARSLLEHGAKVNVRRKDGETPLTLAQKTHQSQMVTLLKRHGAKR